MTQLTLGPFWRTVLVTQGDKVGLWLWICSTLVENGGAKAVSRRTGRLCLIESVDETQKAKRGVSRLWFGDLTLPVFHPSPIYCCLASNLFVRARDSAKQYTTVTLGSSLLFHRCSSSRGCGKRQFDPLTARLRGGAALSFPVSACASVNLSSVWI